MKTIKNYSPYLAEYIFNLKTIELNDKLQKKQRVKRFEKVSDIIIWSLTSTILYVATVQVFGV